MVKASGSGGSRASKKRQKKKGQQNKREIDQNKSDQDDKRAKHDESSSSVSQKQVSETHHPSNDNLPVVQTSKKKRPADAEKQAICVRTPAEILFSPGNDGGGDSPQDEDVMLGSEDRARALLQSMLGPQISATTFYREYWEKKPLLVQRSKTDAKNPSDYFNHILSKSDIEEMLVKNGLKYGIDVNVTNCTGSDSETKQRVTLDPVPTTMKAEDAIVAKSADVWSNFESGCSLRLLCPHLHSESVHALLSTLESEFGCMVGANAYLTPGNVSQGFAPHYDDIEAFVLQLEGKKRWRVYNPVNMAETLPRESSKDLEVDQLSEPVLDITLEPGDFLYMPRGWVHQAVTTRERTHSLHLTVSAMQHWCWGDFFDLIMPEALQAVAGSETSTSLREGLPRNFLSYMGTMHDVNEEFDRMTKAQSAGNGNIAGSNVEKKKNTGDDEDDIENMDADELERLKMQEMKKLQDRFREQAKSRIMKVCREAISMVDVACDQIGKRFLSDRLPPALMPHELAGTSDMRRENGGKIKPNTLCRLARAGIARLVLEDDKAVLYHCADNSLRFHGNPLSPIGEGIGC